MIAMNRKERDKQLRRADILNAAEHVFASKGYHEATIQDIAKEAQYGTGTVYLYFKDKGSLYFCLLAEKIKKLIDSIREKTEEVKDPRRKIEIVIEGSLDYFEKNQDFFRLYVLEKNSIQIVMSKRIMASFPAIEYGTDYIEKIIKLAQEAKVVRRDCNSSELADMLVSILGSVVSKWTNTKSRRTGALRDKARFIFEAFLNGVGEK